MFFGRRRKTLRRIVALAATLVVQLWSLAPMAASVIYCIGEDGHSGFELVTIGSRDCADCCHDGEAGEARMEDLAASECTDIALSPAAGVAGKVTEVLRDVSFVAVALPAASLPDRRWQLRDDDLDPPRGSATRMLRRTVLLI